MPQAEISLSGSVKENQKDESPAAEFSLAIKDNTAVDYDGAKRITVPKNGSHIIDVPSNQDPRFLALLVISGASLIVNLRKPATDANGIEIVRFFYAEVKNVTQLKLTNPNAEDVVVRLFLVCGAKAA
jgi:hypothetical protein